MDAKSGIYPGLSWEEYRAIEAVNNSFLWTLKTRSPAHALYEREHPSEPTPALLFGQALHGLILEPAMWGDRYAVRPDCDRRTKEGKALYEAFCNTLAGRQEVKADEYEVMEAVRTAVRAQQCRELICSGRSEVSIVWQDSETGLLLKGRLDYERADGLNHFVVDVKTTEDASEWGFAGSIARYGYYQAAAMYCDGWQAITGDDSLFVWLAVEKKPPYVTKAWECNEETLQAGRNSYHEALKTCAKCLKTNEWPAYGERPDLISAPAWLLQREGVGRDLIIPPPQSAVKFTSGAGADPDEEWDNFLNDKWGPYGRDGTTGS